MLRGELTMMKKNIAASIGALAVLVTLHGEARAQSSTAGAIQGTVKEQGNGQGMVGATVVATSPALQGSQSAITDDNGQFKLSNLPPGIYVVKFYYAEAVVTRTNIEVSVNRVTPVHVKFDTDAAGGEEIIIEDAAPTIDPTSTTQGITLDQDYTENIPIPGRTFESALGAAAGTQGDALGVSFSGSTSLENSYVVDGVNTTGLSFGTVGSPIINDFIKEIEIITGGYQAEHGRSTGGVVNVVTRSGTNEFHGQVFGYFENDLLAATPRVTPNQATSIDAETENIFDTTLGFDLGGPIIKDKLWFYVGFAPRLIANDNIKLTKRRTDCRILLPDGSLSVPADQPCTPEEVARKREFRDMQRDIDPSTPTLPDIDPETGFFITETLSRSSVRSDAQEYQFISKVNYSLSPEHQGQATFSGTPFNSEARGVNGDPVALSRKTSRITTDMALNWTSKLNDSKTQIEATVGWHRSKFDSRAENPLGDALPHQQLLFGDLGTWAQLGFEDMATAVGCRDAVASDPYPEIDNCPDEGVGYRIGGIGGIADELEQRVSGRVAGTQRVLAAGNHEIKGGIDFENNSLNKKRLLSGGTFFENVVGAFVREQRWIQLAPPGSTDPRFNEMCGGRVCDFLDPEDPSSPNDVQGNTFNWAAYLRDSWQILPNLTFNAGLRYEEQRLRYSEELRNSIDPFTENELGTNAMVLRNMWAPRLGLIYDWTKEGRSKVYASYGRFYESIPMDINDRSFGGETLLLRDFNPDECGPQDPGLGAPDANGCLAMDAGVTNERLFGSGVLVAPGIKAQYLDEFIIGAEYEVLEDLKVGVSYQSRRLGRVIEDVSVDNANTYILANPGEFDGGQEQRLIEEINSLPMDDPERARLENQLEQFQRIRIFDEPRRDYDAVTVTATKRFSRNLFMQGSYTYSRTEGNFPGLFSPDNGQVDPNITSQYDLIELLANRDGPLPQDRPHYFKLDGYYNWNVEGVGTFTPGMRFRALSGIPINTLGRHYLYGFDESFLLPRGALGRTESDLSLDLRLQYSRDIGRGMELGTFIDLRSIFNTQGTFAVDRTYTATSVNPIVGGDYEDLIWAKAVDNSGAQTSDPITRNPNFGNTTVRYSPFVAQLGARLSF
jgi:hypothetical protein